MGFFNLFRKKKPVTNEENKSLEKKETPISVPSPDTIESLLDLKREYRGKFFKISGDQYNWEYFEDDIYLVQYTKRGPVRLQIHFQDKALNDLSVPESLRLKKMHIGTRITLFGIIQYYGKGNYTLEKAFFSYTNSYLEDIGQYYLNSRNFPEQEYVIEEARNNRFALAEYIGNSKDVIIPSIIDEKEISVIQSWSFTGSTARSICLPKSIFKIEEYAFPYCENLKYIEMDSSVEIIDKRAFYENNGRLQCNGMVIIAPRNSHAEKAVRKMGIPCYQSKPTQIVHSLQKCKQSICRACLETKADISQLHFEAIVLVTIIIDFLYACQEKDRDFLRNCTLDWAQRICISNSNIKQYYQRLDFYSNILQGMPLRGEWLFGKTQSFEEDPILRCVVAFGDIISNPDCANDYFSAPIKLHGIENVIEFSNKSMQGVVEAIAEFVKTSIE